MDNVRQFIEEFAIYFEGTGFMRMAGRVLGWLLICDPPHQSMADLVNVLQASKSSISTSTRHLIEAGFVERISLPGQRRDYYRLRSDFCGASYNRFVARLAGMGALLSKWTVLLDSSAPSGLQRLEEVQDIFMFMKEEMPKLFKRWEEESKRDK